MRKSSPLSLALALAAALAWPNHAPAAQSLAMEARVMAVAAELRCLVCQNQTIADSQSGLAEDLRREIREQLAAGQTEAQIVHQMTERYGDFVRYRPPFQANTLLLWLGPGLLLAGALAGLWRALRRRQRLGDDAFEPEIPAGESLPTLPAPVTGGASRVTGRPALHRTDP